MSPYYIPGTGQPFLLASPTFLTPCPLWAFPSLVDMQPGFPFSGSRSKPTSRQGKQTVGLACQAKAKSEEPGNADDNNQSCRCHVEEEDVDKEGGIRSSCMCFLEQLKLIWPVAAGPVSFHKISISWGSPFRCVCVRKGCVLGDQLSFVLKRPKRSSDWLIFTSEGRWSGGCSYFKRL